MCLPVINPSHATSLFQYLLKTSENHWFSDVFRGYQKRPVAWNGLISLMMWNLHLSNNHYVITKQLVLMKHLLKLPVNNRRVNMEKNYKKIILPFTKDPLGKMLIILNTCTEIVCSLSLINHYKGSSIW